MSLSAKFDTAHRQLKAILEEHTAMVDSRLAAIEARLDNPGDHAPIDTSKADAGSMFAERDRLKAGLEALASEVDDAREEAALLMDERDAGLAEIEKLKVENDALKRRLGELELEFARLYRDLKDARSAHYAGCYWLGSAKGRLNSVQEALIVLGGDAYLAETIGASLQTVRSWRVMGVIPPRYRNEIDRLLLERGYIVDKSIFRSLTREESAALRRRPE